MTVSNNGHGTPRLVALTRPADSVATGVGYSGPQPPGDRVATSAPPDEPKPVKSTAAATEDLPSLPTRLPLAWHWAALLAIGGWLVATAPDAPGLQPALVLLLASALARTAVDLGSSRGKISQRLGQTIASGLTLVAVAMAGTVAGSVINPALIVLPMVVWTFAANARSARVSTGLACGAALLALLIAGAGISRSEEPVVAALALAGTSALASFAAAWHGQRVAASIMRAATRSDRMHNDTDGPARILEETRAKITDQHDPATIARAGVDAIARAFRPSYVAVVEAVPDEQLVMPLAVHSTLPEEPGSFNRRLTNITRTAMAARKPEWMIDDGADLEAIACRKMGIEGLLIVPLNHLSREIGAIQVAWERLPSPGMLPEALNFTVELGRWLTPDLAIAQYATAIEQAYLEAMSSLSATVEGRQSYTRGHSRRVARLALKIAEQLGLDDEQQRKLLYAAELHDIGRAGVSDDILGKPGALNGDELKVIRQIPRLSADLIEPVAFFADVRAAILHQHERWDGAGHPARLAGEAIPLLSRILAIADAYDAMTSQRPYREALSPKDALAEVWNERGQKYDPRIAEVFVRLIETESLVRR